MLFFGLICLILVLVVIVLKHYIPPHPTRLYLDDERPTPKGWQRVYTAQQAIEYLRLGYVTEISLDHDLGPKEAGTGYDVAVWIENEAFYGRLPRLKWHIHSSNPVGRYKMAAALKNADILWDNPLEY